MTMGGEDREAIARAAALAEAGDIDGLRRTVAEMEEQAAARLVALLVERRLADALAALDREEAPRSLRKAVRRGLHILRTKGVAVREVGHAARFLPKELAGEAVGKAEAWLAVLRPVAFLALALRSAGSTCLFIASLDDEERILEGNVLPDVSRRGVHDVLRSLEADGGRFADLAPGHAAARIRAALARPPSRRDKDAKLAHSHLRQAIGVANALADEEHPAAALAPADDRPQDDAARAWARRCTSDRLPFALDDELLLPLAKSLNAVRNGPLVLPPSVIAERETETVRRFADRTVRGALGDGLGLRLLDLAWVHRAAGDQDLARAEASAGLTLLRRPDSPAAQELREAFVWAHLRPPEQVSRDGMWPGRRRSGRLILPP